MPAPPTHTRPCTSVPSIVKKRRFGFSIVAGVVPSSATSANRLSSASRGTRTPSNHSRPLSTPLRPSLRPSSSIRTPAHGAPDSSRIGTTKACTPWRSPPDLELGEHHGQPGVAGGVADVVLAGLVARLGDRRGDHELAGRRGRTPPRCPGPGRCCRARLGHREAAHQPPGDQVAQVGVVVTLGAQLQDRAAEQPELHADLDQHRQVAVGQRLERRHRRADVAAAAVLLGEAHPRLTVAAISRTRSRTRSRYSSRGRVSASSSTEACVARLRRTRSRTSAYLPSSSAVSAGTSISGGGRLGSRVAASGVRSSAAGGTVSSPACRRPCNSRYRGRRGRCLVDSRSIEQVRKGVQGVQAARP